MTVASFFAMLAALLTRFGLYAGMFGGGGRRGNNNNGLPVWVVVVGVAALTYLISFILIRMISRYREYAADRGSALITGTPESLMSALQKITSQQLGLDPILMCAANSAGGVLGKMVDAQSICVATAATNQVGNEGMIFRFVFWHSIALACLVGLLVMAQAYLLTGMIVQ